MECVGYRGLKRKGECGQEEGTGGWGGEGWHVGPKIHSSFLYAFPLECKLCRVLCCIVICAQQNDTLKPSAVVR